MLKQNNAAFSAAKKAAFGDARGMRGLVQATRGDAARLADRRQDGTRQHDGLPISVSYRYALLPLMDSAFGGVPALWSPARIYLPCCIVSFVLNGVFIS